MSSRAVEMDFLPSFFLFVCFFLENNAKYGSVEREQILPVTVEGSHVSFGGKCKQAARLALTLKRVFFFIC